MNQKLDLKLKPKNTPKIKKGSRSPVSSFIAKTYEILEDAQFPDIIDWNLEGNAIIIKNPQEFAMKVLSVYFKHRNLTSFVRQLNMYNFRKQRTHKVEHVYCHELFQRDKKYLLEQIKRKNQEQFLPDSDTQEAGEEAEPSDVNQDIVTLIQEKQALKRFNTQASIKISCLEGKVKDLTVQNETLKDQLRQQSERDKILISLMASILKKYGIPPTELTSIMKDDPREVSFQQQPDDGLSFGPSKMDIDISTFLNFDNDSGITKAASTVLNSKANLEAIRDVSPTPLMKNDPYAHWDSVSPRKFFNRSQNMNENEVYRVMNGGMRVRIRGPDMNLGLGKRRFEEEHGFGHESFETVMKKVEFAPSMKKIGEVRPNNEMNMMDQMWMKSKEVEEEFRTDFLNFKYTL